MAGLLLVDENQHFLDWMKRFFLSRTAAFQRVETASDVEQAVALCLDHQIDGAIIDLDLPPADGLQLLNFLARRNPNLKKAAMASATDEARHAACRHSDVGLVLEKPSTVAKLETFLHDVMRGFFPETPVAPTSSVQQIRVRYALQRLCGDGQSLVVELKSPTRNGKLYVRDGIVVHASIGVSRGLDAFREMLGLDDVSIHEFPYSEPPETTLSQSLADLLLESLKRDVLKTTAGQKNVKATLATAHPQLLSGSFNAMSKESPEVVLRRFLDGISEVVVSPRHGEVSFTYKSEDPALRVDLLDFILFKIKRVAALPGFQSFERLEIKGADFSAVIQCLDEQSVFASAPIQKLSCRQIHMGLTHILEKGLLNDAR